jgi:repressor LexA
MPILGASLDLEGHGDMSRQSTATAERGSRSQQPSGDAVRLRILRAVEEISRIDGRSPTLREIGVAVGIRAPSHIAHHVDVLVAQGLLRRLSGSRGLLPARPAGIRILGTIAAGDPLDLFDEGEAELLELDALASARPGTGLSRHREIYALRVCGDSMVDDGILDGDCVLIARGPTAAHAKIAVALHRTANGGRGAATLKWVFVYEDEVHLRPGNAAYATRVVPREDWDEEWEVQGTLVGVYRRYTV